MAAIREINVSTRMSGYGVRQSIAGTLYGGEVLAHKFIITDEDGGSFSGTVSAKFVRMADNVTVPLTGITSNGAAMVTLSANCYYKPGRFILTVFLTASGSTTEIYSCAGNVALTDGATAIDPSGEITLNVNNLIAALAAAEASIPSDYSSLLATIADTFSASTAYSAGQYVWYDGVLYRFTAAHAAGSWTGTDAAAVVIGNQLASVVRTDYQTLTAGQKTAARSNLNLNFMEGDPGWSESEHNIALRMLNVANLAPRYSPTKADYAAGDCVSYEDGYYMFIGWPSGATPAALGAWDWDNVEGTGSTSATKYWRYIPTNPQSVSYALQDLTSAQKAQARANINAGIDTGITPEQFGAKGDGVTNDVQAIQYAFNEAGLSGRPVAFRAGAVYAVGGTYPWIPKRIQVYGNGATIKALDACQPSVDSASCVLSIFSEEGQPPSLPGMGLIENITIDCNGKTNIGLLISRAQGFQIHGIDIRTPKVCGLHVDGNYEIFANSIRVAGADPYASGTCPAGWRAMYSGKLYENTSGASTSANITDSSVWTELGTIDSASTVGVKVYNNDSHYTDIVTKNMGIGVQVGHPEGWGGAANFFNRIHSWNTDPAIIPTSIMFDVRNASDSVILTDCYCDTCAVAVKLRAAAAVMINGMYVLHGGSGSGGHMTPEIMGNVVATVFDIASASYASRVKSFGMIYLSPTETYKLFSLDAGTYGAAFDWRGMNDSSIEAMDNVPDALRLNGDGTYTIMGV